MAFTVNSTGTLITQTGTDADFSGLSAIISGLTNNAFTREEGGRTLYYLDTTRLRIEGTITEHHPQRECIWIHNETSDPDITVTNTGVYNYGRVRTGNNKTTYVRGLGLIFTGYPTDSRREWRVNREGGLYVQGGTFRANGGTIQTRKPCGFFTSGGDASTGTVPTVEIEQLEVIKVLTAERREFRFNTINAINGFARGLVLDGMQMSHRDIPAGIEVELINAEVAQLANTTVDTITLTNFDSTSNISSKAELLTDSLTGGTTTPEPRFYIVVNASDGSDTRCMPKDGVGNTRQRGGAIIQKRVSFNISDADGNGIDLARAYIIDEDSGFRKNANGQDHTADKTYQFTTLSTGLSSPLDVTVAVTNINTGSSWNFNNWDTNANSNAYRVDRRFTDDTATAFIWSYEHLPAQVNLNLRGIGDLQFDWTLFDDNSITETNIFTVNAYTGITINYATTTITISEDHTLAEIRDFVRASKISNIALPTPATEILTVNGNELDFGTWNVVVNDGVTLSEESDFDRIRTSGTLTIPDILADTNIDYIKTGTGAFRSKRITVAPVVDNSFIFIDTHHINNRPDPVGLTIPEFTTDLLVKVTGSDVVSTEVEAFGYLNFTTVYTNANDVTINLTLQTVTLTQSEVQNLAGDGTTGWIYDNASRTLTLPWSQVLQGTLRAILEEVEVQHRALNSNEESIHDEIEEDNTRIIARLNMNITGTNDAGAFTNLLFINLTENYTMTIDNDSFVNYRDSTGVGVSIDVFCDQPVKLYDGTTEEVMTPTNGEASFRRRFAIPAGGTSTFVSLQVRSLGYNRFERGQSVTDAGSIISITMIKITTVTGDDSYGGTEEANIYSGFMLGGSTSDNKTIALTGSEDITDRTILRDTIYWLDYNQDIATYRQLIIIHNDDEIQLNTRNTTGNDPDTMEMNRISVAQTANPKPRVTTNFVNSSLEIINHGDLSNTIRYEIPSGITAIAQITNQNITDIATGVGNELDIEAGAILTTTISGTQSQTIFNLANGANNNDAYIDFVITITDNTGNFSNRIVTDYTASNNQITINEAPDFTVSAGNEVKIYPSGSGAGGGGSTDLSTLESTTQDIRNLVQYGHDIDATKGSDITDGRNILRQHWSTGGGGTYTITPAVASDGLVTAHETVQIASGVHDLELTFGEVGVDDVVNILNERTLETTRLGDAIYVCVDASFVGRASDSTTSVITPSFRLHLTKDDGNTKVDVLGTMDSPVNTVHGFFPSLSYDGGSVPILFVLKDTQEVEDGFPTLRFDDATLQIGNVTFAASDEIKLRFSPIYVVEEFNRPHDTDINIIKDDLETLDQALQDIEVDLETAKPYRIVTVTAVSSTSSTTGNSTIYSLSVSTSNTQLSNRSGAYDGLKMIVLKPGNNGDLYRTSVYHYEVTMDSDDDVTGRVFQYASPNDSLEEPFTPEVGDIIELYQFTETSLPASSRFTTSTTEKLNRLNVGSDGSVTVAPTVVKKSRY